MGPRPIDLHLKAFEAMGAKTTYEGDNMNLSTNGSRLQGAHIYMDTVSVGATINTMLAAVKSPRTLQSLKTRLGSLKLLM